MRGWGRLPLWRLNPPHISMKPKCRVCQSLHWLSEPHVFKGEVPKPSELCVSATNGATNSHATNKTAPKETDKVGDAVQELRVGQAGSNRPQDGQEGRRKARAGRGVGSPDMTANRRSREAYNAYQREYMRKRRMEKRAS